MIIRGCRVQLRHSGLEQFEKPRVQIGNFKGEMPFYNIRLGRWFLAIRPADSRKKSHFFDLGFGRTQLAYFREEKACPWPGMDHYFGLCACPNKGPTHPSYATHDTRMQAHILSDHGATLHPPGYGDGKAIGGTDEDPYLLHSIYYPNCDVVP